MLSVLILTLNEERNLPNCLKSVEWCDDIVVFDSFSTDRTVEIAKAAGARVVQRVFDNERDHREASLKIEFKYPWVYNPDADEITPADLRDEMLAVVAQPTRAEVCYRVRFKTMFMGRWVKHCSLYPTWVVRLFRPEKIAFERSINLRYVANGPEGRLREHFLHYSFNNGLAVWFDKHNRYSTNEAEENLKELQKPLRWGELFRGNSVQRRRFLKELSFRMPWRPTLRFIYMYIFRLGFFDGRAGLTYCRLMSIYEYMIVLKIEELKRRENNLSL